MSEKPTIACCNKPLEIKSGKENGKTLWYAQCPICNKKYKSEKKEDVEKYFQNQNNTALQLAKIPDKPQSIIEWGNKNIPALMNQSAQFIDKPTTRRMIEKNLRYVANLSGKSWDKIWKTPEGQESISYAIAEANYYACTLGEMGDLVPFGKVAEFIPSVENFKFALSFGRNAPFKNIFITPIFENDKHDNSQKSGNFIFEIKRNPGVECIGVAIEATQTEDNRIIGTVLYEPFLIKIAEDHSPGYRSYLIEKEDFTRMKIEGKLSKDNTGREYYEKVIEYEDNGNKKSWTKKIYEHDIVNPYVTSDKVKMLIKTAGKFYFKPYMKVRNAAAMAEEWQQESPENREQAADHVLNRAAGQFDNIREGEIVPDQETSAGPDKENAGSKKESKALFNEDEL